MPFTAVLVIVKNQPKTTPVVDVEVVVAAPQKAAKGNPSTKMAQLRANTTASGFIKK